jgi:Uma2 family endonuclease
MLGDAKAAEAWSIDQPFFSIPPGAGSRRRWEAALRERGIEALRRVDVITGAKPVFVVSGIPGSVGSAARDVWAGLAAAHAEGRPFSIWPFEPNGDGVTVAEIYPRAAYALALSPEPADWRAPLAVAKTQAALRADAVRLLREAAWVCAQGVSLEDTDAAIRSEDDFDALFAAAGLLRCVLEGTALSSTALEDPVAEGGILGTGSINFGVDWRAFRTFAGTSRGYAPACHGGANMPVKVEQAATPAQRATEDDLRATPKDGQKYELVDGQIVVSPAGNLQEVVSVRLAALLLAFVDQHTLGYILGSSAGFRLPGGNVRSPDVSFVAKGRYEQDIVPEGWPDLAPDLAVEVLSPHDRPRVILDKVGEYLQAGVRMVWVIDAKASRAVVYRSLTDAHTVEAAGSLDGEDVLPGFRCGLAEILK